MGLASHIERHYKVRHKPLFYDKMQVLIYCQA